MWPMGCAKRVPVLFFLLALSGEALADSPEERASVSVGGCSGTIILIHKGKAYGVTAAHCAKLDAVVTMINSEGKGGVAKILAVDRSVDLALFECDSKYAVGFVPIGPSSDEAVGWGNNGRKVLDNGTSRDMVETKSKKHFERNVFKVAKGKFRDGDSGGGVFCNGKLSGVISHGEDDEELFCCQASQLSSFLKKHSLKMGVDPSHWGDKDRTREILALKAALKKLQERLDILEVKLAMAAGKPGIPGPAGQKGIAGPSGGAGPAGSPGVAGADGTTPDLTDVNARLKTLEDWTSSFKARIRIRLVPKGR
jgi:hypothetical protein